MKKSDKDQRRLRTMTIFMEKVWLAVTILALLGVFYFFIVEGINRKTLTYLVFPALAGLMYGFRTTFRRRMDRDERLSE